MLARIAKDYGGGNLLKSHYPEGSICDLCDEILHNEALQKAVRQGLTNSEVKYEIAALRALVLNEPGMLGEIV